MNENIQRDTKPLNQKLYRKRIRTTCFCESISVDTLDIPLRISKLHKFLKIKQNFPITIEKTE